MYRGKTLWWSTYITFPGSLEISSQTLCSERPPVPCFWGEWSNFMAVDSFPGLPCFLCFLVCVNKVEREGMGHFIMGMMSVRQVGLGRKGSNININACMHGKEEGPTLNNIQSPVQVVHHCPNSSCSHEKTCSQALIVHLYLALLLHSPLGVHLTWWMTHS